jgi:hypothetical protein
MINHTINVYCKDYKGKMKMENGVDWTYPQTWVKKGTFLTYELMRTCEWQASGGFINCGIRIADCGIQNYPQITQINADYKNNYEFSCDQYLIIISKYLLTLPRNKLLSFYWFDWLNNIGVRLKAHGTRLTVKAFMVDGLASGLRVKIAEFKILKARRTAHGARQKVY